MKCKLRVSFEVEIEFDETEISVKEAIEEVTDNMYFPCEDTDNVTIIEHVVTEKVRM